MWIWTQISIWMSVLVDMVMVVNMEIGRDTDKSVGMTTAGIWI